MNGVLGFALVPVGQETSLWLVPSQRKDRLEHVTMPCPQKRPDSVKRFTLNTKSHAINKAQITWQIENKQVTCPPARLIYICESDQISAVLSKLTFWDI